LQEQLGERYKLYLLEDQQEKPVRAVLCYAASVVLLLLLPPCR
jgi:hypothetical protein